jgi:8-oxo-dGTP pyrophosphatase MutT (NUDIX family)
MVNDSNDPAAPPRLLKLPAEFRERIEAIAAGRLAPPPAKPAATVVVLRDRPRVGIEAFMLRRVGSMAFAPGAYVFPGGSVDARDGERHIGWAGPSAAAWATTLKSDEQLARELVCAAVRETFEETLVLLAGPTADTVVDDTRAPDWELDRQRLLDREQSLAEFLARRGLVLRSDLLRPWAHWITPEVETRRYDTRFFVAAMPPGQLARDVSTEADHVAWISPAEAMDRAGRGEWHLLPPTLATLAELADYRDVADVLTRPRDIMVVEPRAQLVDDEPYLVYATTESPTAP